MVWAVISWLICFGFPRTPLVSLLKIPLPQSLSHPSKAGHWSSQFSLLKLSLPLKRSRYLSLACAGNKTVYVWTGVNYFIMLSAPALGKNPETKSTGHGALFLSDYHLLCLIGNFSKITYGNLPSKIEYNWASLVAQQWRIHPSAHTGDTGSLPGSGGSHMPPPHTATREQLQLTTSTEKFAQQQRLPKVNK